MNDFEELQRRKECLELEKQISKLEREKKINKAFDFLPWKVVIPLGVIGLLYFFMGIDTRQGGGGPIIFGLLLLIPLALKFFSRK